MSDDLDLRGIDQRHEPDPEFRAALERRIAGIVAGTDPGSVTGTRDIATIDLEPTRTQIWAEATQPPSHPCRPGHCRRRGGRDDDGGDLPRRHDRTGRHPDPDPEPA